MKGIYILENETFNSSSDVFFSDAIRGENIRSSVFLVVFFSTT